MANNFDAVAIIYDSLARLIFGKSLRRAQTYMLQAVPPGSRILIVGGGTGWILEELSIVHGTGLRITYVDSSAKMISLAKRKYAANNRVKFISESIKTAVLKDAYDVIITPFFFDMFNPSNAQKIFERLNLHVKDTSLWLYSDFSNNTGTTMYQKALLRIMYIFFRLVCGIEAKKLPEMDRFFKQYGYEMVLEKSFWGSFIVSRVYQPRHSD